MASTSVNNFRPGVKAFGFRSPHYVITNYFAKVQAKMIAHPFFKRFSQSQKIQSTRKTQTRVK